MACLIPRRIVNPHYKKIAPDTHFRLYHEFHGLYPRNDYYVTVDCGKCINCFRKYMSSWRFRLIHEYLGLSDYERKKSYYVTLTFEDEFYTENPIIIKKYVRRFLDRCRKRYGHSVRHFLVTEFGEDTNRLHFHGFFFNTDIPSNMFYQLWYYGFVSIYRLGSREHSVLQEISYCTTYVTKGKKGRLPDVFDIGQKPLVLVSPGLGLSYASKKSSFHQNSLSFLTYDVSGHPYPLPRYLRQKVFTQEQLKKFKNDYFLHYSPDVIPDPPYYIGSRVYHDYSLYLEDTKKIKRKYLKLYGK